MRCSGVAPRVSNRRVASSGVILPAPDFLLVEVIWGLEKFLSCVYTELSCRAGQAVLAVCFLLLAVCFILHIPPPLLSSWIQPQFRGRAIEPLQLLRTSRTPGLQEDRT